MSSTKLTLATFIIVAASCRLVLAEPVLSSVPYGTAPFMLDINDDDAALNQPGWETMNGINASPASQTFTTNLGVGGSLTVSFSGHNYVLDYSAINSSNAFYDYNLLLRDGAIRAGSSPGGDGPITFVLDTLEAGSWDITSYHHSTANQDISTFDIFVTDADSTNELVFSGQNTIGFDPTSISTAPFVLDSDGINPITIVFERTGQLTTGNTHFVVNGFELAYQFPPPLTPEPSSIALLLVAGTVLCGFGVWKRKRGHRESQ